VELDGEIGESVSGVEERFTKELVLVVPDFDKK